MATNKPLVEDSRKALILCGGCHNVDTSLLAEASAFLCYTCSSSSFTPQAISYSFCKSSDPVKPVASTNL